MFKVLLHGEEIAYDDETIFISDLFAMLLQNQFSLSNLNTLQLNLEIAINMLSEFLQEQKEFIAEKKTILVKTISKEVKREFTNYNMKITRLLKRMEIIKKNIIHFSNIIDLKSYILGIILSLEHMSLMKGYSLSDIKGHTDFGNAEVTSWTTRRRFQ